MTSDDSEKNYSSTSIYRERETGTEKKMIQLTEQNVIDW